MTTHAHHAGEFGYKRRPGKAIEPKKGLKKGSVEYEGRHAAFHHGKMVAASRAQSKATPGTAEHAKHGLIAAKHAKKAQKHATKAMIGAPGSSHHYDNASAIHADAKGVLSTKAGAAKTQKSPGEKKSGGGKDAAYHEKHMKFHGDAMKAQHKIMNETTEGSAAHAAAKLKAAHHEKKYKKHEKLAGEGSSSSSSSSEKPPPAWAKGVDKKGNFTKDASKSVKKYATPGDKATDFQHRAEELSDKANVSGKKADHGKAMEAHAKAAEALKDAGFHASAKDHENLAKHHQNEWIKAKDSADGKAPASLTPKQTALVKSDEHGKHFEGKYDPPKLANQGAKYDAGSLLKNAKEQDLATFKSERTAFTSKLTSSEKNAALSYSGSGYGEMNGGLRKGMLDGATKAKIEHLDAAINKHPAKTDMIVHRGTGGTDVYSKMKAGDQFVEHGYSSTSAGSKAAFSSNPVNFVIHVPKGHPAAPIPSKHPGENEVLLPRGTKFTLMKDPETKDGKTIVHLMVSPHD